MTITTKQAAAFFGASIFFLMLTGLMVGSTLPRAPSGPDALTSEEESLINIEADCRKDRGGYSPSIVGACIAYRGKDAIWKIANDVAIETGEWTSTLNDAGLAYMRTGNVAAKTLRGSLMVTVKLQRLEDGK